MAARIGCIALDVTEASTLAEMVASVQALMGSIGGEEWSGCHLRDIRSAIPVEPSPGRCSGRITPSSGKTVAFTGALVIPCREAMQAVVDCGGVAAKGLPERRNCLSPAFRI